MQNVIWGNENPPAPEPHAPDCTCWACEMEKPDRCQECGEELKNGEIDYCFECLWKEAT